jgi:hypothetical protein
MIAIQSIPEDQRLAM